jgi:hypothetical protein
VTALNLIEIDFHGEQQVLKAWKEYFENLRVDVRDANKTERAYAERPALLTKLLHEIAKVMHYPIEQLDIMEGGYAPQAVADNFLRQLEVQTAVLDVLSGRRPLRVKNVDTE